MTISACLTHVDIHNLRLFHRFSGEIDHGLVIVLGETGAGKSFFLRAIALACGGKVDGNIVDNPQEKAVISLNLLLSNDHPAWLMLMAQDLMAQDSADQHEIVLRRVIDKTRSHYYVNDIRVSVKWIQQWSASLFMFQGQFDRQKLMDQQYHMALLDNFAGLIDKKRECRHAWQAWKQAQQAYEDKKLALEQGLEQREYWQFVLQELDAINPQKGEYTILRECRDRAKLYHQQRDKLQGWLHHWEHGVKEALWDGTRQLDMLGLPEDISHQMEQAMNDVWSGYDAMHAHIIDYRHAQEDEDGVADDDRFFALAELGRKYRCDPDELSDKHQQIITELSQVDAGETGLEDAKKQCDHCWQLYQELADYLSIQRTTISPIMAEEIQHKLADLWLGQAQFRINVAKGIAGAHGQDKVVFETIMNPGDDWSILGNSSSGGELSRFLLLLKLIMQDKEPGMILVFDEIDSGIGGATAQMMARQLASLARYNQLLLVTHNPQLVCYGQQHYYVKKSIHEGRTRTDATVIQGEELLSVLGVMLAGEQGSDNASPAHSTAHYLYHRAQEWMVENHG